MFSTQLHHQSAPSADLSFGASSVVLPGGYAVDLHRDGGTLWAAASSDRTHLAHE